MREREGISTHKCRVPTWPLSSVMVKWISMEKIPVGFGFAVHAPNRDLLEDMLLQMMRQAGKGKRIVTLNPEMILAAQKNAALFACIQNADLILADGGGLRLSAFLLGARLRHRHPGVDILVHLISLCAATQARLLFLGKQEEMDQAKERLLSVMPGLQLSCLDPGKLQEGSLLSESVIEEIRILRPAVIAVGLGHAKQEFIAEQLIREIPTLRVVIGVGGAFAMLSGRLPRAPRFLRRLGLEWLWRLGLEPQRFRRITDAVLVFPCLVFWSTVKTRFYGEND